ncbi:hypothetical protein FND56_010630 [Chryseoglobus frigidaquae]|nr:Rv3654c family TadE-like protein [Microcella frigidaquae]NHN45672.1 hypothetical protein [Microcella frigidaquae]
MVSIPARPVAPAPPDHGAGTVLIVGLVAVLLAAGLALVGAGVALARGQQLSAAADAAALAAGDVLLGWVPGEPCAAAARVAAAHSARLLDCSSEGLAVTVRVGASILGIAVERSARAGAADLAE